MYGSCTNNGAGTSSQLETAFVNSMKTSWEALQKVETNISRIDFGQYKNITHVNLNTWVVWIETVRGTVILERRVELDKGCFILCNVFKVVNRHYTGHGIEHRTVIILKFSLSVGKEWTVRLLIGENFIVF